MKNDVIFLRYMNDQKLSAFCHVVQLFNIINSGPLALLTNRFPENAHAVQNVYPVVRFTVYKKYNYETVTQGSQLACEQPIICMRSQSVG